MMTKRVGIATVLFLALTASFAGAAPPAPTHPPGAPVHPPPPIHVTAPAPTAPHPITVPATTTPRTPGPIARLVHPHKSAARAALATEPKLPAGASPLMTRIFSSVRGTAQNGTVPGHLMAFEDTVSPEVMITGPEAFPKIASLMTKARHEILLETYVWQKSETADTILNALPQLQKNLRSDPTWDGKPVEVKLLINQRAPWMVPVLNGVKKALPERLMPAEADRFDGAKAVVEKAVAELGLDPRYVKVDVAVYKTQVNGALHAKTILIDGETAVATGMNVQRSNDGVDILTGKPKAPSNDAAFLFQGAGIGGAMRADFAHGWARSTGETLGDLPPPAAGQPRIAGEKAPMLVVTRAANGNPFSNRVDNPQGQAFLSAIKSAQREIRLMGPNLNDDAVKAALVDAVKDGKVVKIVLGKGFNDATERLPLQGGTNDKAVHDMYAALRKAGVASPERLLQVRWYSEDGKTAVVGADDGRSHLKYQSYDGQVAIVGSGNLDTQSLNHSQEFNVVVDSAKVTASYDKQIFEPAWSQGVAASTG
jgi:phosphatidylserine/phosphatidylglycerophosphate/cardiolipin synthase-like enzyme